MARKTKAAPLTGAEMNQLLHLPEPAQSEELRQLTGAQTDQLLNLSGPKLRDAVRRLQLIDALAKHLSLSDYWMLEQNLLSIAEVLQLAKDASIVLPPEVVASYKQQKFPESDDDGG
jgi:hypothetical protein